MGAVSDQGFRSIGVIPSYSRSLACTRTFVHVHASALLSVSFLCLTSRKTPVSHTLQQVLVGRDASWTS